MKTIIIIFISIYSTLCFSQNNDLYILIDKHSKLDTLKAVNDSLKLNIFRLKFNSDYLEYEFYKDRNGNLKKSISVKSKKSKIIELEYKNVNNDNPLFLIPDYSYLNQITFDDMIKEKNFNKLKNLIKSYNNIYLINKDDRCNGNYVVKKVNIKSTKSEL